MPIAAAAIGAGTSLFSGIMGAHEAGQAAKAQQQAAQKAQQTIAQNQQQALGLEQGMWGGLQGATTPYQTTGKLGAQGLAGLYSKGLLLAPWKQQFQAPTAEQAAQTPGYQFMLQQGLNAMQGSAAARGNLLTGGTMKDLNNYAQGMASTNYQQTYNNAFQNYLQNYGQFQQNQQNQYNRLMGMAGIGETGTGQLMGTGASLANTMGNTMMTGAQQQAQAIQGGGQAQAAGYMNTANAMGSMGQGLNNAAFTYAYGPQIFGQQQQQQNPLWYGGLSPTQISSAYGAPGGVSTLGSLPGAIPMQPMP